MLTPVIAKFEDMSHSREEFALKLRKKKVADLIQSHRRVLPESEADAPAAVKEAESRREYLMKFDQNLISPFLPPVLLTHEK